MSRVMLYLAHAEIADRHREAERWRSRRRFVIEQREARRADLSRRGEVDRLGRSSSSRLPAPADG